MTGRCGCGRPLIARPGDLEDTCAECRSRPDYCACAPLVARVTGRDREEDQDEEVILPAVPAFPHQLAYGPLRDMLDWAERDGLPVSFVAAAGEVAGAGAAAAVTGIDGRPGPGAKLRLTPSRVILPILWQVLIGESGDGKNPSIDRATEPVARRYDALVTDWEARCELDKDTGWPRPQALMQSSASMEAIIRWLSETGGAGILRNGELASFLRGLGQYKAGGGSDRFDAMDMWSGEPISIERVGQGGAKNAIRIYVRSPRLSVIGGLVPDNVKLLGPESDGLRARFLPALPSSRVIPNLDGSEPVPESWNTAIRSLYECRHEREWHLRHKARALIQEAVDRWTARRTDGIDPVTVRTALAKADEQCLRIALVVSELAEPGKGGEIPEWAAAYAVARVDYALGCWLALGSDQTMAFSRKDEVINAAVAELLRRIERRPAGPDGRKWMTRRDIQHGQVGGATTAALVDQLIISYLRAYPRSVLVCSDRDLARYPAARMVDRSQMPGGGGRGPAPVVVLAPLRSQDAGEYTLLETVGPTVSQSVHARSRSRKTAGEGAEPSPDDPRSASRQFSSDSFPPDSFPPAPVTPGDDVTLCALCSGPLHPALAGAGITTHPACEPGPSGSARNASERECPDDPSQYVPQKKNAGLQLCTGCGEPMRLIEPGQRYHPACEAAS